MQREYYQHQRCDTVGELIEQLSRLDEDLPIKINKGEPGIYPVVVEEPNGDDLNSAWLDFAWMV